MKPFNERINGFAAQFKEQMASLYDQGYKQGYSDGLEQRKVADLGYKDGLEYGKKEAWECAKKIASYVSDGGLASNELLAIFGEQFCSQIFVKYTASEAIAKIKEHEEQEQKDSDSLRRLRFYDEIIYDGNHRGVIIDITSNGIKWVFDSDGSVQALDHDVPYRITGRQFPEILDILDRLQEGDADECC